MTGWLAVVAVAVLIVTGAWFVVALDRWIVQRQFKKRKFRHRPW